MAGVTYCITVLLAPTHHDLQWLPGLKKESLARSLFCIHTKPE